MVTVPGDEAGRNCSFVCGNNTAVIKNCASYPSKLHVEEHVNVEMLPIHDGPR